MLFSLDGNQITNIAHARRFQAVVNQLGAKRAEEVRAELHRLVDNMVPDPRTGQRTFSSSFLGSALTPWPYPLAHLYDVAWEIEGQNASDEHVEDQAALIFGQFVWECIMQREEKWVFYDPNLSPSDPNREFTGKVYFERPDDA